jgi:hypothetical protein
MCVNICPSSSRIITSTKTLLVRELPSQKANVDDEDDHDEEDDTSNEYFYAWAIYFLLPCLSLFLTLLPN